MTTTSLRSKTIFKRIGYWIYLFCIVFILLEIALRIYNPFHIRLKGDKIVLPVNLKIIINNSINPKLDSVVVNTRNSLGFRGPEPPADWSKYISIITIGGSTTECHFLDDTKTWPYLLGKSLEDSFHNIWLNNAGLDGHSSFGHLVLLNDYIKKKKPSLAIFLMGINEVESDKPSFHDKMNTRGSYPDLRHFLFENSEVLNLSLNLARGWRAQKLNNTTNKMVPLNNNKPLEIPEALIKHRKEAQKRYLLQYQDRLIKLMDTCMQSRIIPVLVTQPNLFGLGIDPVTQTNLELFESGPNENGKMLWQILEMYNEVTRKVAKEKNIFLIDLANELPKDSRYFYDHSHFTNEGAAKIAAIIKQPLCKLIQEKFPDHRKSEVPQ